MNPLEQITAALQARTQPAAQVAGQQPLAFVPAPAVPFGTQVGPGAAPANNPFNPGAAFAAAVPAAAQSHVHPVTQVPFAPINPPGEAAAPVVGLDQSPVVYTPTITGVLVNNVNGTITTPPAAPEAPAEAPKAQRSRKPRASSAPEVAAEPTAAPSAAGSGVAAVAVESVSPLQASADFDQALHHTHWKVLVDALKAQGFCVTISAGSHY